MKNVIIDSNTNNTWNSTTNSFECNQDKECASSIINCSAQESCSVYCSASAACVTLTINCPKDADCSIICDGSNVCVGAVINGPLNHLLHVICNSRGACEEMQIHAENASYFNLTITAIDISIWFPPRDEISLSKRSYADLMPIHGGDRYSSLPHFYALNGFEDIDIDYPSTASGYYSL